MEPEAFDQQARRLSQVVSRRAGLSRLGAGLLALLGVGTAQPAAAAKPCLRTGTRCHRHSGGPGDPCRRCCSGFSQSRPGSKGRRCTCVPAGKRCRHSSQCCGTRRCVAGRCGSPAPTCGTGGPCTVFLRAAAVQGNAIGGLAGADALCQASAEASGSLAPAGTYLAWLSDTAEGPATRFLLRSPGPYVLVDGTEVAASWDGLTDGTLTAPINRSETGTEIGLPVWTNTTPAGLPVETDGSGSCGGAWNVGGLGWVGNSPSTSEIWTDHGSFVCPTEAQLYCFQQD